MTFREYLNQPFPYKRNRWKEFLLISLFVSVFLFIFQPISIPVVNKQLILLGYGAVGFFTVVIVHFTVTKWLPKIFNEETWTIKKQLFWYAFQLFIIGISNFYYSAWALPFPLHGFQGVLTYQLRTIGVGILPVTIHIVIVHNYLLSKILKSAGEMNDQIAVPILPSQTDEKICFSSENEKDKIEVSVSELYFIESFGNYIKIFYGNNGTIKKSVLRCSLKRVETLISTPDIVKCHRAYLVNVRKVSHVKGNSQGYRLCLGQHEMEIPLARNFSKGIRALIESVHSRSN
jgi:hypothetical protein